jgi:hypothetical protein
VRNGKEAGLPIHSDNCSFVAMWHAIRPWELMKSWKGSVFEWQLGIVIFLKFLTIVVKHTKAGSAYYLQNFVL